MWLRFAAAHTMLPLGVASERLFSCSRAHKWKKTRYRGLERRARRSGAQTWNKHVIGLWNGELAVPEAMQAKNRVFGKVT